MSISVDDLVASLSSNHIGQEAIDLATLHAQLAQTLFAQPSSSMQSMHRELSQHSNTPLARTPSSSMCWEAADFTRGRSTSVASMGRRRESEDMEDERMVEDLLCSSPPSSASTPAHFSFSTQRLTPVSPPSAHHDSHARMHGTSSWAAPEHQYELPPANTSMFATTDPFFLAQLQAAQTPSVFAQAGRPPQHSPFMRHGMQSEVDPHHYFAPSAPAFKC